MTETNDEGLDEGLHFIIQNCGFPTFDEFRKNPDKWRRKNDDLLESADQSSIAFRKNIQKTKYMWKNSFECKSLEQIERIAKEEGYKIHDLAMCPQKKAISGSNEQAGVEVVIQFWPKLEFELLGGKTVHEA
jgi:hypothetical protein